MEIQTLKLEQLNPAKYNPRKKLKPGDPEFEKLKRSIETFGFVELIVVNRHTGNTVISGHQRLAVLKHLKWKEAECVIVDLDTESEKALNVAMNKVGGEFDIPLLSDLLKDLDESGFDVSLTGFDIAELSDLFGEQETKEDEFDADKVLDEITEPITKKGDIWLLGKHRLVCGDSTSVDDVNVLMDNKKARMVFTDPPWNVAYGSTKNPKWKNGTNRQILNDSMSTEQFGAFLMQAFNVMKLVSEPGCMTYVVMSAQEWGNLMNVMSETGYHWSSTIIWKKDRLVLSRKDYHTQFEPIWYGWLEGTRLCPLKDRKQSDVWEIPRPKRSDEHPTMKPIELVARAIQNSSLKGDIVLDLFGGSGSTLIAADQTGRTCHTMELDPKYCDVIVKRFIEHTGSDTDVYLIRGESKTPYKDVK